MKDNNWAGSILKEELHHSFIFISFLTYIHGNTSSETHCDKLIESTADLAKE